MHGGKWTFVNLTNGATTQLDVNETTPSKIAAAVASAATTLSTTAANIGIGDIKTPASQARSESKKYTTGKH